MLLNGAKYRVCFVAAVASVFALLGCGTADIDREWARSEIENELSDIYRTKGELGVEYNDDKTIAIVSYYVEPLEETVGGRFGLTIDNTTQHAHFMYDEQRGWKLLIINTGPELLPAELYQALEDRRQD